MGFHATVTLHVDDSRHAVELRPGQVLGRLEHGLTIRHPAVSEAHALCSLRGHTLVLLPLRGALFVHGRAEPQVRLEVGLRVFLAEQVWLEVKVLHPDGVEVLLDVDRVAERLAVPRGEHILGEDLRWDSGAAPLLEVWPAGASILAKVEGHDAFPLSHGAHFTAGGRRFDVLHRPGGEGIAPTVRPHLLLRPDREELTVEVLDAHCKPVTRFAGRRGEFLHALLGFGERMVHWQEMVERLDGKRALAAAKPMRAYENLRDEIFRQCSAEGIPPVIRRPARGYVEINWDDCARADASGVV